MNFLIFDNEFSSLNLIDKLLSDFNYVKLITSNESKSTSLPSSSFLSINQGDISNASQVIEHIYKHEDDPLDAILIFNLSLFNNLNNVIKIMERLKRKSPRLFLIFTGQGIKLDPNLHQLLQKSSKSIQWTIIFCNEINCSTSKNYHIETEFNPIHQQPISATDLLAFLSNELNTKKYLNKIIFLY